MRAIKRVAWRVLDEMRHRGRLARMPAQQAWGHRAEDLAHRMLEEKGLLVVARNWVPPSGAGEIDIAAVDGMRLAIVEVKSRSSLAFSAPERALSPVKIGVLDRTARALARRLGFDQAAIRYDLVTVVFEPFEIRHLPDAWTARGADRIF